MYYICILYICMSIQYYTCILQHRKKTVTNNHSNDSPEVKFTEPSTIPSDRPGAVHTCHSDAPNVAWIRTQQRLVAGFNEWKLCQMKQVFSKLEQMLKSFRIENWGELEVPFLKSQQAPSVSCSRHAHELGCCRYLNLRDITWSMHFHVQLEETAYDLHCKSVRLPSGYLT
jgi:hypothetical protein